jgi:cell shape-determining protein MreC
MSPRQISIAFFAATAMLSFGGLAAVQPAPQQSRPAAAAPAAAAAATPVAAAAGTAVPSLEDQLKKLNDDATNNMNTAQMLYRVGSLQQQVAGLLKENADLKKKCGAPCATPK